MRWSLASPAGSGTVAAVRAAYVAAAPTRVTAKTWSTVPSRFVGASGDRRATRDHDEAADENLANAPEEQHRVD